MSLPIFYSTDCETLYWGVITLGKHFPEFGMVMLANKYIQCWEARKNVHDCTGEKYNTENKMDFGHNHSTSELIKITLKEKTRSPLYQAILFFLIISIQIFLNIGAPMQG